VQSAEGVEPQLQRELHGLAESSAKSRRLYLYAAGLVGLAEREVPVLVMPNAGAARMYSVDLLEWVNGRRLVRGVRAVDRWPSRARPVLKGRAGAVHAAAPATPPGALFVAAGFEELEVGRRTKKVTRAARIRSPA
jgi:hypothetical protein